MPAITALIAGLLFGCGLIVSGMANPAKVHGFLNLAALWDPSLGFVMVGAITVSLVAYVIATRRKNSLLALPMQIPANATITRRLILGSAVFGVGWGLAGFCPGPGLVALGAGYPKAAGFLTAMVVGMALFELVERANSTAKCTEGERARDH